MKRRNPTQARARATYDAILDGAVRVLVEAGFDGITTNAVAATAGVSIGSLYQYFSNKEELVVALIDRHHTLMKGIISDGLRNYAGEPADVMVRGTIRIILAAQGCDRELFRALRQQLPRDGRFFRLHEVLDFITDMVAMALAARQTELGVANPMMAAFFVVHAVDGILEAALRKGMDDQEALVNEVSNVVMGYLSTSSTRPN